MTLRTGPSLTTLALLGASVLALHLGLLSGGRMPIGASPHSAQEPAPTRALTPPPAVRITQVRQVTHMRPAPPAPTMVANRPKKVAAAPAPPAPAPVTAIAEKAAPVSAPAPAAAETAPPQVLAQVDAPTPPPVEAVPPDPPVPAGEPAPPPTAQAELPSADIPPSITLPYEVTGEARGYAYRASGQFDWRHDAQGYEARMELSMLFLGSRVQTSRGGVGPEGLRPERFADRRSSERAAHFDREAGRIRFSNNARPAPLLPGAQDRLSLFMQLSGLLRARQHAQGEVITFQVVGVGDAETWQFEVGPLETVELPAGTMEARRITRTPRKPHDSTVEVWLAPSVGHLPVRLRVAQANGDVADQRLARLP